MGELGDDFFAAEEEKLDKSKNIKKSESDEENGQEEQNESQEEEQDEDESMKEEVKEEYDSEEDTKQGITMQPMEDSDDDLPLAKRKNARLARKERGGRGKRR